MISKRVNVISGKLPILVIAPHGFSQDDENTNVIAEYIARRINCYAVINEGWERDGAVDIFQDKADCNNVTHCLEDVVREEFLEPILRFRNKINKTHGTCHIFYIHGMSDKHRKLSGDSSLDIVVGYGAGTPDSLSCESWRKDSFINLLYSAGFNVYQGKRGGLFSGWARNNMNQLFRKWWPDSNVHSMQLEIVHELRQDEEIAKLTADCLAVPMENLLSVGRIAPLVSKQY